MYPLYLFFVNDKINCILLKRKTYIVVRLINRWQQQKNKKCHQRYYTANTSKTNTDLGINVWIFNHRFNYKLNKKENTIIKTALQVISEE